MPTRARDRGTRNTRARRNDRKGCGLSLVATGSALLVVCSVLASVRFTTNSVPDGAVGEGNIGLSTADVDGGKHSNALSYTSNPGVSNARSPPTTESARANAEQIHGDGDVPAVPDQRSPGEKPLPTLHTVTRTRNSRCSAPDCRLLVTGCGRSGTHFLAEELKNAGAAINHETIGEAGTVSWIHAAPFQEDLQELETWFSDEKSAALRGSPEFAHFPVFHLVRHPLPTIASLTECFCGCGSMTCGAWADTPSWKWAGKFVDFSDRYCSRNIHGEVCAAYKHPDGRLLRSMEYWVEWNKLVEKHSNFRFQLETVKLAEMARLAPQLNDSALVRAPDAYQQRAFSSKRTGRRPKKPLSWDRLRLVDSAMEEEVWQLAQSYGYTRNPP